ncbi:hypothetical protein SCUP515_12463 [Seiridium cupressi]
MITCRHISSTSFEPQPRTSPAVLVKRVRNVKSLLSCAALLLSFTVQRSIFTFGPTAKHIALKQMARKGSRKCDGYAVAKPRSDLSWHRPRQLFPGISNSAEGRALQFFCEVAGPLLPGATDPYFWTHVVMQFSNFEPAVRHAVVAISSLYERHQSDQRPGVISSSDGFALQHYTAAIRELRTTENQPLVLLVCVLFICIEFLQSNKESAIIHCKHGINVLGQVTSTYPWTREHLVPIFRRLSLIPFFFAKRASDLPSLAGLDEPFSEVIDTFEEARTMIDVIMSRAMQLVRWGDEYRLGGLRHTPVSPNLLEEQELIGRLLDRWHASFTKFAVKMAVPASPVAQRIKLEQQYVQQMSTAFLSISYETGMIWRHIAFACNETEYDDYMDGYRRVVEQALAIAPASPDFVCMVPNRPKFIFEMGFVPLLYFVVVKCRDLETRLLALRFMQSLGVPRESLWDVNTTYALGRRIIEVEHGVTLDNRGHLLTPADFPGLPPEHLRVRGTWTEGGPSTERYIDGNKVVGKMIGFYLLITDDSTYLQTEFLPDDLDAARLVGFNQTNVFALANFESATSSTPTSLTLAS